MKAAVLSEAGGVPAYEDVDEPNVPEGHELSDVLLAGINPVDIVMANGATVPSIVGREGIARLADGRRVYFDTGAQPFGSMAERAPVDPAQAFPLPDGLDDGLAVALGIAGTAAWLALRRSRLERDQTVLVLGATGVVGQIATQAAKALGASRVVAAGRDADALAAVRGVDDTVVLTGDDQASLEAAGGEGFDVVVDTIFGPPLEAALAATAPEARLVSVGGGAGASIAVPLGRLFGRTLSAHSNGQTAAEVKRDAFAALAQLALDGAIEVDVERAPLADIADVWRRQAEGSPHRKLVLVP